MASNVCPTCNAETFFGTYLDINYYMSFLNIIFAKKLVINCGSECGGLISVDFMNA